MSVWCVQTPSGEDERVEADALTSESGSLFAMSDDGLIVRGWAAGQWRTVRQEGRPDGCPAGERFDDTGVLVGFPRG